MYSMESKQNFIIRQQTTYLKGNLNSERSTTDYKLITNKQKKELNYNSNIVILNRNVLKEIIR